MSQPAVSEQVRLLLDAPRGEGMVVSCYADVSVEGGFKPHWCEHLNKEAARLRELMADDPNAIEEFEGHLTSIRGVLESSTSRHARGMAVFSASGWKETMAFSSRQPFENRLVVDEEAYLVPLLVADLREREYLVVVADTHRGQIHAAGPDESRLVAEVEVPIPPKQSTAGERRRAEHIHDFEKELVQRIDRAWADQGFQGILLVGEHVVLENLRALLPPRLAERVVHEAPLSGPSVGATLVREVQAVATHVRNTRQDQRLDSVRHRLKQGFAVATGPQEVIDALRNGQVAELVIGPDAGEVGSRCPSCRSVFALERADCPYCQARCEKVNLWQEILVLALKHSVAVETVAPAAAPALPNNIAALLCRDAPQWSDALSVEGADDPRRS